MDCSTAPKRNLLRSWRSRYTQASSMSTVSAAKHLAHSGVGTSPHHCGSMEPAGLPCSPGSKGPLLPQFCLTPGSAFALSTVGCGAGPETLCSQGLLLWAALPNRNRWAQPPPRAFSLTRLSPRVQGDARGSLSRNLLWQRALLPAWHVLSLCVCGGVMATTLGTCRGLVGNPVCE